MRAECKNFESRSYPNGDTVRKCNLDLAPDAPWRCPDNCPGYERRLADVAWTHGSLVVPPTPPEPAGVADGSAAALLDEAENILNAAGEAILAEQQAERTRRARRSFYGDCFGATEPRISPAWAVECRDDDCSRCLPAGRTSVERRASHPE